MSEYVCRVDVKGLAVSILSSGNEVVDGDMSIDMGSELEDLDSPGVDSQRMRERRRLFAPLTLRLIENFLTAEEATSRESTYKLSEGKLCLLTTVVGSATMRWDRVTIQAVKIAERGASLHGFGAISGNQFSLVTEWTFRRQQRGEART